MDKITLDCSTCDLRDLACNDCVVQVLLGPPVEQIPELTADEQRAVHVLAACGMLPPLRMVRPISTVEDRPTRRAGQSTPPAWGPSRGRRRAV